MTTRCIVGGRGLGAILLAAAIVALAGAPSGAQTAPADQRVQKFLEAWRGVPAGQQRAALEALVFADRPQRSRPDRSAERLLRDWKELGPAQRESALRALAAGDPATRALADYGLGNVFTTVAADSGASGKGAEKSAVALLDSARVHFEGAVARDSTFVEAYVNLGSVYDDLSTHSTLRDRLRVQTDQQSAEKAYKRAVALRPEDEKARCNLGALYVRLHREPDALEQFQTVLKQNPKSALAHYNLAIMFADAKIYREAVQEWRAAAKADPQGDIGKRSEQNVKIVEQMMTTPVPKNLGESPPDKH